MTVKWDDPPEELAQHRSGGARGPLATAWLSEVAELKSRPGQWGRIAYFPGGGRPAYNLVDNIRRGRVAAFRPQGTFEARAIKGEVWVRWTGGTTNGQPEHQHADGEVCDFTCPANSYYGTLTMEDPERCDECGATMPHDESLISEAHRVTCSLHPASVVAQADAAVRRIRQRYEGEQRGCRS